MWGYMKKQLLFARLAEGLPKEELCHRLMKTTSPLQWTATTQRSIYSKSGRKMQTTDCQLLVRWQSNMAGHIKWQGHQILSPCNRANNTLNLLRMYFVQARKVEYIWRSRQKKICISTDNSSVFLATAAAVEWVSRARPPFHLLTPNTATECPQNTAKYFSWFFFKILVVF